MVVSYQVDDDTVVGFEFEPIDGFVPAGLDEIAGRVRKAVEPAVAAAQAVLEQVKALSPDGVEVKFGVKVTGTTHWLVAKAATEGNFEVTLAWHPRNPRAENPGGKPADGLDGHEAGSS
jgi:Trypsin-co-occurring domain 1